MFGKVNSRTEMKYLGFVWRVLRRLVWQTATDTTAGLAAQMAYLLLFALAPGLLFLWHLLGLFGTDPAKLHQMFLLCRASCHPIPKCRTFSTQRLPAWWSQAPAGYSQTLGLSSGFISARFLSPPFLER